MAFARGIIEGRPEISRNTEDIDFLPHYLTKDEQGMLVINSSYVIEGARVSPYEIVMDFGTTRAPLKGLVPQEQRLTRNTNNLTVLSFEQPMVKRAMDHLTDIANDFTKSSENPAERKIYREHLASVYYAMAGEAKAWGGKDALFFTPKNGGIFVQEIFEEAGLSSSNFFDYRMSRVQKNDHGLMIGATFSDNNPDIAKYKRFVFADDCLASDISAFATLELIKEKLAAAKVPLSEAEILVTVSAATQRGLESLLSQDTLDHFGFGSIKAVVGTLVYQMDDHFYLQHPDGRYVVGDMGNWTKPIAA
jgi:uncharacterized protein (UPF0332 family)